MANHGEERVFKVYGREMKVSKDFDYYNQLRQTFREESYKVAERYEKMYSKYGDIKGLVARGQSDGIALLCDVVERFIIAPLINEYQIFDIDKTSFYKEYCKGIDEAWTKYFNTEIHKKIDAACSEYDSRASQREIRKSCDKVVGGGFGVSGYVSGQIKAGAINVAKGAGHSVVNSVANAFDRMAVNDYLKTLYERNKNALCIEIARLTLSLVNAYWDLLSDRHLVKNAANSYTGSSNGRKRFQSFIANLHLMDANVALNKLPELILEDPYWIDNYVALYRKFGDSNCELEKTAKYFGINFLIPIRKEVVESYYNGLRDKLKAGKDSAILARAEFVEVCKKCSYEFDDKENLKTIHLNAEEDLLLSKKFEEIARRIDSYSVSTDKLENLPVYEACTLKQDWEDLAKKNNIKYETMFLSEEYTSLPDILEKDEIVLCITGVEIRKWPGKVKDGDVSNRLAVVTTKRIVIIYRSEPYSIRYSDISSVLYTTGQKNDIVIELVDGNSVSLDFWYEESADVFVELVKAITLCPQILQQNLEKLAKSNVNESLKAEAKIRDAASANTQDARLKSKAIQVLLGMCFWVVLICVGVWFFYFRDGTTKTPVSDNVVTKESVAEKKPENLPVAKKQAKAASPHGILVYEVSEGENKGAKTYFLPSTIELKPDEIVQVSTTLIPVGKLAKELEEEYGERVAHIDNVVLFDMRNKRFKIDEVTLMRDGGVISTEEGSEWDNIEVGTNSPISKLYDAIQPYLVKTNNANVQKNEGNNIRTISGTRVNMRSEASKGASVIFQFPGHETVTVIDEANPNNEAYPWYKVSYNGHTGWVYGQFVK